MPQIRCTEGTGLRFNGSDNKEQMHVTLSGLLFSKSSVSVQDSSLDICNCKFKDWKQSMEIRIRTRIVLSIKVTNSMFSKNNGCMSVFVSNTNISSQNTQIVFNLTESSFDDNALSDKESCISVSGSAQNTQSVACNITLKNVAFSRNRFGSKGLLLLETDNGSSKIHFQNVKFTDNSLLSTRNALVDDRGSECIAGGTNLNIGIDSSTFESQRARSLDITASHISLQIHNSSFCGHRVNGNGGGVSVKGTDLCKVIVANSSFVNTTAAQGGAINIECLKVESVSFRRNTFKGSLAKNGSGGAVYIYSASLCPNDFHCLKESIPELHHDEHSPQISITQCNFINANSLSGAGAVHIQATSVRISQSRFINCASTGLVFGVGSVILITTTSTAPIITSSYDLLVTVEHSLFMGCRLDLTSNNSGTNLVILTEKKNRINITDTHFISNSGGAIIILREGRSHVIIAHSTFFHSSFRALVIGIFVEKGSIVTFNNVSMESNTIVAGFGGSAVFIGQNCKLLIQQSRFLNNKGVGFGTVFSLFSISVLEVQDSLFDGNYNGDSISGSWQDFSGGAIYIDTSRESYIAIINTTFNNCVASQGGALFISSDGNVTLEVKGSRFVSNFVPSSDLSFGGAVYLSLAPDAEIDPGCIIEQERSRGRRSVDFKESGPSWAYKSNITFEDTILERNAGSVGGAVYFANGKVTFRNCSFIDNVAATQGGHIYSGAGSASLDLQNCHFRQKELQLLTTNYIITSFLHTESSGGLKLYNTTMDAKPYRGATFLILVRNSRLIDLGNNNLTMFYCPVGSQIQIVNFTDQVTTQVNSTPCSINVTTLEVTCSACEGNSYSLQRGVALGYLIEPGFKCFPCPFGANCSQNIIATPNFWGFEEQVSPPALKFTMCPLGYCRPPNRTDYSEYNGCQGNRFGELCGQCGDAYTETLFSTNCRPSHECNDYWFFPAASLYVLVMALYFTFMPPIVHWIKHQILWFKTYEEANEEENFDRGYLKIIFYFYQVADIVLVASSSPHILEALSFNIFIALFNFQQNVSSSGLVCPIPGITVATKQLFSAFYVFGTCLMIAIIYTVNWAVQKFRGQEAPFVGPYIGGTLQTMLLGYKTLASISFDLLRCVPIGSEKRLFYDGNVECFQWWQYILIGFVCSFLVPFVFVLLWGSFKLYSRTLSGWKFLFACCFPLPSLLHWLFNYLVARRVHSDRDENSLTLRNSANDGTPSDQVTSNFAEKVLYDTFKRPEDGGRLSLGWESVLIGRRLILIVLKAFISDPLPRLLVITFFCVLFFHHHAMTQPFRDSFANTVETISLLFLTLLAIVNVFFASFISLAVTSDAHLSSWWSFCQVIEVVIICAVPALFCLLVFFAVLSQLGRLIIVVTGYLWKFIWICVNSRSSNQDNDNRLLLSEG